MFDPGQPGATPVPPSDSAGPVPPPGPVAPGGPVPSGGPVSSAGPVPPAGPVPRSAPASPADAMAMVEAGLAYLAEADLASVPAGTQAECLRGLVRAESLHLVARSVAVTAFGASRGYEADGQYSPRTWLQWQTRTTRRAASLTVGWARRLDAHPAVRAALAAGDISVSWAQQVCAWSDRLPEEVRGQADVILLSEAAAGADLDRLSGLAEELFRLTALPDADDGKDFTDRSLAQDLTFGGAGRLVADLTPECAAAVMAMLESLGKRTGPLDERSLPQLPRSPGPGRRHPSRPGRRPAGRPAGLDPGPGHRRGVCLRRPHHPDRDRPRGPGHRGPSGPEVHGRRRGPAPQRLRLRRRRVRPHPLPEPRPIARPGPDDL
jgi:hypothetical protein